MCVAASIGAVSCGNNGKTVLKDPVVRMDVKKWRLAPMPRAVIYRTDGNCRDNVPVVLNPADGDFVSFPGPGDVSDLTTPMPLTQGWLLDRAGMITPNTAFLNWTMGEYHALDSVPATATLKRHIIPGARVTAIVRLPMTYGESQQDTAAVNALIRQGLPGCDVILDSFTATPHPAFQKK